MRHLSITRTVRELYSQESQEQGKNRCQYRSDELDAGPL
jgi:hypothetical protein